MGTTSLATLVQPLTREQLASIIRAGAAGQGLPVSDWPPTADGGIENGLADMVSGTLVDYGAQPLADAIAGGFLGLGTGDRLTFLAQNFYRLAKNLATTTIQAMTLTCAPAAGPHTIQVGDLWFIGASGNRYQNTEGGVLSPGTTIVLKAKAESPGASYNDAPDTIRVLGTSLPGVTVTNARIMSPNPAALVTGSLSRGQVLPFPAPMVPYDRFRLRVVKSGQARPATAQFEASMDDGKTWAIPTTPSLVEPPTGFGMVPLNLNSSILTIAPGVDIRVVNGSISNPSFFVGDVFYWSNSPLVQQGSDDETDLRLAGRCRSRWLTLSDVATPGTVELWAKNASPEVMRVKVVSDPNVANAMLVYIGSSSGTVGPTTVVAVQEYISDRVDKDSGESANVLSVGLHQITVSGSVQVPRKQLTAIQEKAEALWTAYLASLDIGATVILAELQQAIMDAGAIDFQGLSIGGSPNVVLGGTEVAVPQAGTTLASLLYWEPS